MRRTTPVFKPVLAATAIAITLSACGTADNSNEATAEEPTTATSEATEDADGPQSEDKVSDGDESQTDKPADDSDEPIAVGDAPAIADGGTAFYPTAPGTPGRVKAPTLPNVSVRPAIPVKTTTPAKPIAKPIAKPAPKPAQPAKPTKPAPKPEAPVEPETPSYTAIDLIDAQERLDQAQVAYDNALVRLNMGEALAEEAHKNLEAAKSELAQAQAAYQAELDALQEDIDALTGVLDEATDNQTTAKANLSASSTQLREALAALEKADQLVVTSEDNLTKAKTPTYVDFDYASLSTVEKQRAVSSMVAALINDYRVDAGLHPLPVAWSHDAKSAQWSQKMAKDGKISHDLDNAFDDATNSVGQVAYYENVLSRPGSTSSDPFTIAKAMVEQWRNSPGHHLNLLNKTPDMQSVGIYFDGNRVYATWRGYSAWAVDKDTENMYMPDDFSEFTGKSAEKDGINFTGIGATGEITYDGVKETPVPGRDLSDGLATGHPEGIEVGTIDPDPAEIAEAQTALDDAKTEQTQAKDAVEQAEVKKAEDEAELAVADAEVDRAQQDLDEVIASVDKTEVDVAQAEVDQAQGAVDEADAEVAAAQAEVKTAEAEVAEAEAQVAEIEDFLGVEPLAPEEPVVEDTAPAPAVSDDASTPVLDTDEVVTIDIEN